MHEFCLRPDGFEGLVVASELLLGLIVEPNVCVKLCVFLIQFLADYSLSFISLSGPELMPGRSYSLIFFALGAAVGKRPLASIQKRLAES